MIIWKYILTALGWALITFIVAPCALAILAWPPILAKYMGLTQASVNGIFFFWLCIVGGVTMTIVWSITHFKGED